MASTSSLVSNTLKLKNPKLLLLESCSSLTHLKIIHAFMIRTLTIFDTFSVSRLISISIDNNFLDYAVKVFNQVQNPNLFIFNAFIRGFSSTQNPIQSFHFYVKSQQFGIFPDNLTYPFLIKACNQMGSLNLGIQAHCHVIKRGFDNDVYVKTSLVNMYSSFGDIKAACSIFKMIYKFDVVVWTSMICSFCKVGDIVSARKLFDEMPERNLVTWGTMINGYVKNSLFDKAIDLYDIMKLEGIVANETVMVSVISSYAHLGALEFGEKAHEYMVRNGINVNMILGTALVDMYARCGSIDKAVLVFEELPEKDALCWTALISGFAMHGHAEKALEYFSEMIRTGVTPRDITFTAVLSACSHKGLVERGMEIFETMKRDYGIEPMLEHYGCIVDLLGRAGKLAEAEKFVLEMPGKPNAPIYGALLGACLKHKNAEIADRFGKILIELRPKHSGYYVLLSNIYARTNKWENVETMRQMMKERGIKKPPGYSLIEIDGKVHKFTLGDESHPEIKEIERMWEEILKKIKPKGYSGNTSDSMFDIDEEEKENALHKHSEKLAIAYGIMKTRAPTPIRIVKNLRVCEDCHTATKLISKVYSRELIVRDRNRFHHFKSGTCSCMDYW